MNRSLFFKHLLDYPSDRETGWSHDLQGVTHDADHWFITQKDCLWKIPVGIDLNGSISGADPARGIQTAPIPGALVTEGYDHLGDLDFFDGYLFIAVEGGRTPCIACFDAVTLTYIDRALVPQQNGHASWCAVNPAERLLYSSDFNDVSQVLAYRFSVVANQLELTLDHTVSLLDEGSESMEIDDVQGGVFTLLEDENHLYLTSNNDDMRGVHVFRWPEAKRIQKISIDNDFFTIGEEIEGITYWDLDGGDAPVIRGQVHVLELDNDPLDDSGDVKGFKHYRAFTSPFVANRSPSKREVHRFDCIWIDFMLPSNKVPYGSLQDALDDGFDGCHYCLAEHDTR